MTASAVATVEAGSEREPATPTAPRPMPRWRVWLVYAILLAIVGGHLVEVVTQREHWPYSPYPMWSHVSRTWEVPNFELRGVTDEPTPREMDLYKPAYLYPLPSRFMNLHMIEAAKKGRKAQEVLTRDTLAHYEKRRKAGLHDGPPLKSIKLYQFAWTMNADATNARQPDRVTLIYDSTNPAAAKAQADQTPPGQEAGRVDGD